jgi:predicted DNA-binding transcriptional regulator AlpA
MENATRTYSATPDSPVRSAAVMVPIALDIPSACRLAGFGRSTLYEEIKRGAIQTRRIGRKRLVLTESLVAYIHALPAA